MMTLAQVVGSNVARLRAERDWSYREMSALFTVLGSRCDAQRLIAIEKGRRDSINIDELIELSVCFSAPISELLRAEGDIAVQGGHVSSANLVAVFSGRLPVEIRGGGTAHYFVHQDDPWAVIVSQQLEVTPTTVVNVMERLYGKSATQVRTARIREAGAHGKPFAVRTISRELRDEIRDQICDEVSAA
jgi:transcriptional regulator with XRE-family HTH domain